MYRILILVACVCFHVKVLSTEEINITPCQQIETFDYKIYLKPSQIYFSNDKIFVQIENNLVEVSSLMTDAGGIYCGVRVKGYPNSWDCPMCETHHNNRKYCDICGYWPGGAK